MKAMRTFTTQRGAGVQFKLVGIYIFKLSKFRTPARAVFGLWRSQYMSNGKTRCKSRTLTTPWAGVEVRYNGFKF